MLCPRCGSRAKQFVYGLTAGPPTPEEEEEFIFAGCSIDEDSPRYGCPVCHHEWGTWPTQEEQAVEQLDLLLAPLVAAGWQTLGPVHGGHSADWGLRVVRDLVDVDSTVRVSYFERSDALDIIRHLYDIRTHAEIDYSSEVETIWKASDLLKADRLTPEYRRLGLLH